MKISGITATYYSTTDIDRATRFYTGLLGAVPTGAMPGVYSEWVFENDSAFGLYAGEHVRPSDGVMFIVDDVAAAVAECKAKGIEMNDHIEDTPVCWMAFGKDADGNGFILHKHKDAPAPAAS